MYNSGGDIDNGGYICLEEGEYMGNPAFSYNCFVNLKL